MADTQIVDTAATGLPSIWEVITTIMLAIMGFLLAKRSSDIDENTKVIQALSVEIPKIYATKETMRMLFQEVTVNNKEAIARVEKQVDETKIAVKEQTVKIDSVKDTINQNQAIILQELSKKT